MGSPTPTPRTPTQQKTNTITNSDATATTTTPRQQQPQTRQPKQKQQPQQQRPTKHNRFTLYAQKQHEKRQNKTTTNPSSNSPKNQCCITCNTRTSTKTTQQNFPSTMPRASRSSPSASAVAFYRGKGSRPTLSNASGRHENGGRKVEDEGEAGASGVGGCEGRGVVKNWVRRYGTPGC